MNNEVKKFSTKKEKKLKNEIKTESNVSIKQEPFFSECNLKNESFIKNELVETKNEYKLKHEPKLELNDPETRLWHEELRRIKEMMNVDDEKLITSHLKSIEDFKVFTKLLYQLSFPFFKSIYI